MPSFDELRREGMADACVLIVASKRLPSTITYADLVNLVGLGHAEGVAAVDRFKARARRANLRVVAGGRQDVILPGEPGGGTYNRAPRPARPGEKWCGRCSRFRPVSEFGVNRNASDGPQSYCRPCAREASRESHARRRAK